MGLVIALFCVLVLGVLFSLIPYLHNKKYVNLYEEAYKGMKSGIVAFDRNFGFIGANPKALALFPKLADLKVGEKIEGEDFAELGKLLRKEQVTYKVSGKFFEADVRCASLNNVKTLWLMDKTAEKENLALLKCDRMELEEIVENKTRDICEMQSKIIMHLAEFIECRDDNTGGHVRRTSFVVRKLMDSLLADKFAGVDETFCEIVSRSAPMHDVGKIGVPDSVLLKNGKLTDEEFTAMKSHAERGGILVEKVLSDIEDKEVLKITKNVAMYHHEKWGGNGYPKGLKGEEIPLEARVMAVADVYDALVSKRCYKDPMPFDVAKKIMDESFGSHFDPALQPYFEKCLPEIERYYAADR